VFVLLLAADVAGPLLACPPLEGVKEEEIAVEVAFVKAELVDELMDG
jgi:hypothetical protein